MITLVENRVIPNIEPKGTITGRLLSWWEAYGNHPQIAQFYKDEQGGCAVLVDGQAVLVCSTDDSRKEFSSFFSLRKDIQSIYTDITTAEFLGSPYSCIQVMRCEESVPLQPLLSSSPKEIYDVLSIVFTDFSAFEPWYLDVSYRMRHNLCHQASVRKNDILVSTAMTVAEWEGGALLGSVATLPEYRRCGYAAQCVLSLTAFCQQAGKTVYISPKNESAKRLYASLGFKDFEKIALIERK